MHSREKEYNHRAHNARKRGGEEQNAQLRAQWEILGETYVRLADQSKKNPMTPASTIRWIVREPCGPQVYLKVLTSDYSAHDELQRLVELGGTPFAKFAAALQR